MSGKQLSIPVKQIEGAILFIRGYKVMMDKDLAMLYGVKPIALRQQVKRNKDRFPKDFVFKLTEQEAEILVSQNVIPSKQTLGGHLPYAFTEQGVAMLSSILRSKQAVHVNIEIMRAFVRLRQIISSHKELAKKLDALEEKYDVQFKVVFDVIKQLMIPPVPKTRKIGFRVKDSIRGNIRSGYSLIETAAN